MTHGRPRVLPSYPSYDLMLFASVRQNGGAATCTATDIQLTFDPAAPGIGCPPRYDSGVKRPGVGNRLHTVSCRSKLNIRLAGRHGLSARVLGITPSGRRAGRPTSALANARFGDSGFVSDMNLAEAIG